MARSLSVFITDQLLSKENLYEQLTKPEKQEALSTFAEDHIANFIEQNTKEKKLTFSSRVTNGLLRRNRQQLAASIAKRMPAILLSVTSTEQFSNAIRETIYTKVSKFSSDELEQLLNQLIKKELRFVELLGGLIGFIVGIGQIALLLLLSSLEQ